MLYIPQYDCYAAVENDYKKHAHMIFGHHLAISMFSGVQR